LLLLYDNITASPQSSVGSDAANELNAAVAKAVICFVRGNKDDEEFARTLAKKALTLKTNTKRYRAVPEQVLKPGGVYVRNLTVS
jgi:hypothetical protein